MNLNPAASLIEFIHDVVYRQDAPRLCQWRNAVLPSINVADFKFASRYLQESHAKAAGNGKNHGMLEPYTIEMRDQTLVSFVLVRGARLNISERDIGEKASHIAMKMTSYMSIGNGMQHSFGIHFINDPTTAQEAFEQKVAPLKQTAKALGGDANEYFQDLSSRLVAGATEEMCLMVVRTHMRGLRPDEMAQASQEFESLIKNVRRHPANKSLKGVSLGIESEFGQACLARSRVMLGRHESLATKFCEDLAAHTIGISAQLLSSREAIDYVMAFADREHQRGTSHVAFLGQESALNQGLLLTQASIAPLKLGIQILRKKIRGYIDGSDEVSQLGGVYYGVAVLEMGPISPEEIPEQVTFDALMRKIRGNNLPVAVNYNLRPMGLKFNALSRTMNAVLGSIGSNNRMLRDALDALTKYQERSNGIDTVIGWQAIFTTWGETQQIAQSRLRDLKLIVQGWGSAQPMTETGAPDLLKLESIPEYTPDSCAMVLPAPLSHVLYTSPLMRPSSPWDYGHLLFKTLDGVLYPVSLGSHLQNSYVTGVVAPSGGGKSFLLNRIHGSMCLAPGQTQLPYLCLIDVGPGGDGYQRLLRTILPQTYHSQLLYFKVINSPEYCINPFDVQLGCDKPMSMEREFITAVLTLVLDGIGAEAVRLSSSLIDAAYEHFSPTSTSAKIWQGSYHDGVTQKLRAIGVQEDGLTAYQVRDLMFEAGYIKEAIIAQRYAVPNLQDLTGLLTFGRIKAMYQTARADTGESLLDGASRAISQATSEFPVISGITLQDIDNARCVIINLQNVTAVTTASGLRFAGMMYLYARHLGSRHFFIDKDEIKSFAQAQYQDYQQKRVSEIQSTAKILSYDEWHNVKRVNGLLELNIKEARETRKFRVYLNFITQYFTDIPDAILDGMTTLMVVSAQTDAQNKSIRERLKISETDYDCLSNALDSIGKMWCMFKLKNGMVTTVLKNDIGAFESWCYTTDDKDKPVRDALIARIGEAKALTLLSQMFPQGTANQYIERMANHQQQHGYHSETSNDLTLKVVDKILEKYGLAV